MRFLYIVIFFLGACAAAFSQAAKARNVAGVVTDPDQSAITSATAVILHPEDSTIIGFGITNGDGKFLIRRVPLGDYILQVSFVGYQAIHHNLEVTDGKDDLAVPPIVLELHALDEVTVTADRIPMEIVKDTIAYNAAAFRTQPNDVVEDLLKKLPGVEVDADGTITAQGEEVQQVLVDGKEFFGTDATIATRNLPANAVDKVEVFDKKSDLAEFTGIDDGQEQKAINLELKADHKKGLFGSLTAGYGTEDRYQSKVALNQFNKNTQLSLIGMLNNINRQGFSPSDYVQFAGGLANVVRGGGGRGSASLGGNGAAISSGLSDGFVETGALGLNVNHEFSKNTDLNLSYFYSGIDNINDQQINRENIISEERSFFSEETSLQETENNNHRINALFEHKIDSSSNFRFRGSLAFNNSALFSDAEASSLTTSGLLQNQSVQDNDLSRDNISYNGQVTYRKKFHKPGRSISLSANFRNQEDEQLAILESVNVLTGNAERPSTIDSLYQDQFQTNNLQRYGWTMNYIEPIGKSTYLGLEYTRSNDANQLKRDVYDLLDNNELVAELSNHYNQDYLYDRAGLSMRWIKGKSNVSANFNVQRSLLEGEILSNESFIRQRFVNFVPQLRWNFDIASSRRLMLNYRTNVNEPSLTQLQPIADNSNPLNIYIGNPDLVPSYSHRMQLRYFSFSQFSMTNFFATLTGTYTKNDIVNAKTIDEQFRQISTPINVDNTNRLSTFVGFGTPLKIIGSRINLNANYSYSRGVVFINTVEDMTDRNNVSMDLSFDNLKKNVLDLRVGTRIGRNTTTYKVSEGQDQQYVNQGYYTDIDLSLGGNWNLGTKFDYNVYSGGTRETTQSVPLWQASLSAFIMKKKGEIKLTAFDILNQNVGIQQNVDLNYIEDIRIQSLGQYFMMSFTYAINQFANQGQNNRQFRFAGPRGR